MGGIGEGRANASTDDDAQTTMLECSLQVERQGQSAVLLISFVSILHEDVVADLSWSLQTLPVRVWYDLEVRRLISLGERELKQYLTV